MANAKEIRTQIKSIQNTKKITKAMEMVAASKKRKAQDHMEEARPYAEKIREVAAGLARSNSDIKHAFLTHREVKTVGYIVVTSDRGLCGGLNINLFKALLKDMQTQVEAGRKVVVSVFGSKGHKYLANLGVEILASQEHLGDLPKMQDLLGVITTTVQAFEDGEIDQVF